jgi:hypothetical protein
VRRFEEAITAHQDAAAIFREVGDAHRLGIARAGFAAAESTRAVAVASALDQTVP